MHNQSSISSSKLFVRNGLYFYLLIQDELTPGEPIGVKIERINGMNKVQFSNASPHVLDMWRKALEKKINQRNFHQLFKAKKKIGKGAFATVYLA